MKKLRERAIGVLAVVLIAVFLSSCAGGPFGPDLAKMTADQIKEAAKVKDANVTCVEIGTPWGAQRAVTVSVDRAVVVNGSVSVSGKCEATFTNAPASAPVAPPR